MANLETKIQEARENLEVEYREALGSIDITSKIDRIAGELNLSKKKADKLDKEITFLVLRITDTPDFIERAEKKLDINDDQSLKLLTQVTEKILRPLQDIVRGSDQDMPVPPPPPNTGMPDSSSYGGASDPYREPVDDES
jgi:hypothetical protein